MTTRTIAFVLVGAVVFCSILSLLTKGMTGEDAPKKRAIPNDAELGKARELARSVYGDKVKAASDNDAKDRLVAELLRDAGDNVQDPPAYYAILQLARNLAVMSQNVGLAMDAIQSIDDAFEIETTALRLETLGKIVEGDAAGKQHRIVAAYAYFFAEQALLKGNVEHCHRFIALAIDAAKRGKNNWLVERLQSRKASIERDIAIEEQRKTLLANPTDPVANFVVGKQTCLVDGKWESGLPLLDRGNKPKWKKLAERELKTGATPEEMVDLAGGWYELAAAEVGAARDALLLHAAQWYRKALPELKGLRHVVERNTAEGRLSEIEKSAANPAPPPTGGPILESASPFASRSRENRRLMQLWYGGTGSTTETERAVAAALYWLSLLQMRDGTWSLKDYTKMCKDKTCTGPGVQESLSGATALGLLPFLAAGQTHQSAGAYQKVVSSGVNWLISHQRQDGDLSAGADQEMYSHGLAAIALCEDYGMSRDRTVGKAAQLSINFIQAAQNTKTGGWRYHPGEEGDTSVVGWQFMALKSAQMAGLTVNPVPIEGTKRWLVSVGKGAGGGQFSYQPDSGPMPSTSAVGLLCSQYLHADRHDPVIVRGVQYLMTNQPDNQARNTYYWYYATQVLRNMADKDWAVWNRRMQSILVTTQALEGCAAGSWDPDEPVRDAWGPAGGRIMMTSLSALILEASYRHPSVYGEPVPSKTDQIGNGAALPAAPLGQNEKLDDPAAVVSIPVVQPDQAEKRTDPTDVTAAYLDDWSNRFSSEFAKATGAETTEKKVDAEKKVTKSFHDEMARKTLTFRFPIKDVRGSGPTYVLSLDGPIAIKMRERWESINNFSVQLQADQAKKIRPGDFLIFRGKGESAFDNSQVQRLQGLHCHEVLWHGQFNNGREGDWYLFLDRAASFRIESKPNETDQPK